MAWLSDIFRWEMTTGEGLSIGDRTITPQSQALTVRWRNAGVVWNRPVAVIVEQDGQTERIPILDVTRAVQLGLLGLCLVFVLIPLLSLRGRTGRREAQNG